MVTQQVSHSGDSAGTMVAAMLIGFEDLVVLTRADTAASLFYLNGFTRFTGDRTAFLGQASMIGRIAEIALHEIMDGPGLQITVTVYG